MRSELHNVVVEKLEDFYASGIPATFERDLSLGDVAAPATGNLVQVIVGVRRCGKTYRLYQEMHRILALGVDLRSILYFNFDDERLKPYDVALLDDVVETFFAMNPKAKDEGAYLFFDEIQEVPEWGTFMRRMVDTQKASIYVTGSSSKMLSLQMATEFRGRSLSRELFPMSFSEYLRFHGHGSHTAATAITSSDRARLRHECGRYLAQGGFIATQALEPSDAVQLLQEYANRTVNYDIMERYSVSNARAASLFLSRCIASSGCELSVNKVRNDFKSRGIAVSRETLSQLLTYYEEAFLLFTVRNYSVALADNARSSAKVYAVDPALFSAFSPAASSDTGQRLETAVFNKLRREAPTTRRGSISSAIVVDGATRREIDFVVGDELVLETPRLIQASISLADGTTRRRELAACSAGMRQFGVSEAIIVTLDEEDEEEVPGGLVRIVPAWKWLL